MANRLETQNLSAVISEKKTMWAICLFVVESDHLSWFGSSYVAIQEIKLQVNLYKLYMDNSQ